MDKLDFKKADKALYTGKPGRWDHLTVPPMRFLMIDGMGDPDGPAYAAAISALYPLAYGLKFAAKGLGRDFAVPPLEALWWADDMSAYLTGDRAAWKWTSMIRMPDFITNEMFADMLETVLAKQAKKKEGATPETLRAVRLETFDEGECLQTLHVGPYRDEAPVLAHLHDKLMPEMGLAYGGNHHEIYLSDPRRVAPEKLKTILRQPVQPA